MKKTKNTNSSPSSLGGPNQRLIEPPRRFIMAVKPKLGFYGRFIYR